MKAFLVGLLFLIGAAVLLSVGSVLVILLMPFLIVVGVLMKFLLGLVFVIFCVWLLGKFIIYVFEKMKDSRPKAKK